MRALIVIRLSRVTDATTSPERQLQTCHELCERRGYQVVGVAEDLDVSAGSTSPFMRPALSRWIGDGAKDPGRVHEFDVIVFYRVDRLVRRVKHLGKLIDWSEEHDINLISATESHFDLSTPIGRIIAQLVASFAEMELEAISERATSSARHNTKAGKYRGGSPPWGYLPDNSTGEWRYVQDPEQVAVINEVAGRVLAGEPLRAIARDLTRRGVLTAKDRFAQSQGREVKGCEWGCGPLKNSLTSPTMLGHVVAREPVIDAQGRVQLTAKGKKQYGPATVVRNDDGSPVVRSTPILTREVFDRVGAELASREKHKEPTVRSGTLLLRVIYCGVCGKPMYRLKGGPGRSPRYRCSATQYKERCVNGSAPMAEADHAVTTILLDLYGDSDRMERVWDSGSDHSAELAEIDATLADLADQLGSGAFRKGTPQRDRLDQRITALADRQAELSAQSVRPASWIWKPTGETFKDWWGHQDITAKNMWLRSMNVQLEFNSTGGGNPRWNIIFGDLQRFQEEQLHFGDSATEAAWRIVEPKS